MNVRIDDLVRELKLLRKGRGISVGQIGERVGPALRTACGVSGDDSPAELRRKVAEHLTDLAATLPGDLHVAVMAAFGLDQHARMPFYQDRVHWAATMLKRDDRTVRRRIDEGIVQLAELAVGGDSEVRPTATSGHGWHTEQLRVTLAMDQPVPEAFEFRRVVADQDELTELDLALTLTTPAQKGNPRQVDELEVDVFHGGRLIKRAMESSDRFSLVLDLPETLNRGDQHEFTLRFRARMQPHFVCVPRHPCELFDLHIHFDTDRLPRRIWQLTKAFQDDARDPAPTGETIDVDRTGEVHARFHDLSPGFAYGIKWEESPPFIPDEAEPSAT